MPDRSAMPKRPMHARQKRAHRFRHCGSWPNWQAAHPGGDLRRRNGRQGVFDLSKALDTNEVDPAGLSRMVQQEIPFKPHRVWVSTYAPDWTGDGLHKRPCGVEDRVAAPEGVGHPQAVQSVPSHCACRLKLRGPRRQHSRVPSRRAPPPVHRHRPVETPLQPTNPPRPPTARPLRFARGPHRRGYRRPERK
jgi:hypothetical protein